MSETHKHAEGADSSSSAKGRLSERVARRTTSEPARLTLVPRPSIAISDESDSAHIVLVDPTPTSARVLGGLLRLSGHRISQIDDPAALLPLVQRDPPQLVLLDSQLAKRAIFALCTQLKQQTATHEVPICVIADRYNRHEHLLFTQAGADDYCSMASDYAQLEARIMTLLQPTPSDERIANTARAVHALLRAITAHDPLTGNHLQRTGSYALLLGRQLGLHGMALTTLHFGALLHDVGKIGIDDAVLGKVEMLNRAESHQVQQHPLIGERIVYPLQLGTEIAPIVRGHHERWDGTGYPDRLRGSDIPLGARIVAVVDAFDSLTTTRPGLQPLSTAAALEHLRAGAGKRWDARLIAALQSCMRGE